MSGCNAYESGCMSDITGETLRPGGFTLTEKAIRLCDIQSNAQLLDLGCGRGATLGYLYHNYGIFGVGIDPSIKLLTIAKSNYPFLEFVTGSGDKLPFEAESFSHVFAECTLSLIGDLSKTMEEVSRVLKRGGYFIITDVYAKNPSGIKALEAFSFNSCMRGLHDIDKLKSLLEQMRFTQMFYSDYSDFLKELMVKIIFRYGSMDVFWGKATEHSDDRCQCNFQEYLKACKPGYFMLILKKGG